MEEIEVSATTVEEAIKKAEAQVGIPRDGFEVEVIREAKAGLLGVGGRDAVIRVFPLPATEEAPPEAAEDEMIDIATDVLNNLLELMDVNGKVDLLSAEIPVAFDITGDDLGILIGRRGQTLASLEYITKLIVTRRLQAWVPLSVDVAGYRRRRYESLQRLALYLAEQVKSGRRSISMEPMPANERRIVHLALADNPDVTTHSIGDGEERKVVVQLRQS
jgi:spoIIIJ-associated protein